MPPLGFEPVIFGMLAHLSDRSAKSHPTYIQSPCTFIELCYLVVNQSLHARIKSVYILRSLLFWDKPKSRVYAHLQGPCTSIELCFVASKPELTSTWRVRVCLWSSIELCCFVVNQSSEFTRTFLCASIELCSFALTKV
jgi:hypothetical protein